MTVDINAVLLAKLTGQEIPRDEPRVRVRVTTMTDGLVVAGVRFALPPGEERTVPVDGTSLRAIVVEAEVYESDVAKLEALVEDKLDKASVSRVEDDLRAELAEFAKERVKGLSGDALVRAQQDAERAFPGSFPGFFRRAFKRDLRPIVKVDRIPEKTKKAA